MNLICRRNLRTESVYYETTKICIATGAVGCSNSVHTIDAAGRRQTSRHKGMIRGWMFLKNERKVCKAEKQKGRVKSIIRQYVEREVNAQCM